MNSMVMLGGIRACCVYDGGGFFGRANGEGGEDSCCCSVTPDVLEYRRHVTVWVLLKGVVAVKVPQPRLSGAELGTRVPSMECSVGSV